MGSAKTAYTAAPPVKPHDWVARALSAIETGEVQMPGLPEMATRVHMAATDPTCTAGQLAALIAEDPVIAARVVKVANSAAARGIGTISSLERAVSRLGFHLVRTLVTGLCLMRMIERPGWPLASELLACLERTRTVSSLAWAIADPRRGLAPETALLAGLVHDIGILPLLDFARRHRELLDAPHELSRMLRMGHPRAGAMVLERWRFADYLVAVAREHENFLRISRGPPDYVDVIIVANVEAQRDATAEPAHIDRGRIPAFQRLGLPVTGSLREVPEIAERYAEARERLLL